MAVDAGTKQTPYLNIRTSAKSSCVPDGPSIHALIADAIQSANIDRRWLGFGKSQDQTYLSNGDSEHAATTIVQRLAAFGYEIRKKDG
jgi:hypothetical protein